MHEHVSEYVGRGGERLMQSNWHHAVHVKPFMFVSYSRTRNSRLQAFLSYKVGMCSSVRLRGRRESSWALQITPSCTGTRRREPVKAHPHLKQKQCPFSRQEDAQNGRAVTHPESQALNPLIP